jgi:hypothetical protein
MYGISPDDRLWMVNRDQAERRRLAEADGMAKAARDGRRARRTEAAHTGSSLLRHPWTAVSHAAHALGHAHLHLPTHGTAH